MNNVLFLASKSPSRRMLLDMAQIPYFLIDQSADELLCDWSLPLQDVVQSIAHYKMSCIQLADGTQEQIAFVLTADTLIEDSSNNVCGKPDNYDDAVNMVVKARTGSKVATAFCIEKRIYKNTKWITLQKISQVVHASYILHIPDASIDNYFNNSPALDCAGACSIEHYGAQFLKSIDGSYSTVIGLPLFEVRCALEKMGFFK